MYILYKQKTNKEISTLIKRVFKKYILYMYLCGHIKLPGILYFNSVEILIFFLTF